MKRIMDVLSSGIALVLLSPVFLIISIAIVISSKGPVFYKQTRVGEKGVNFSILKFRTMRPDSDKSGLLTVGNKDSRVTKVGYYLRRYKLDELPQLINVLYGSMSIVGPRPEVREYVNCYQDEYKTILSVKPGITDYASIKFRNENELLKQSSNPEATYVNDILPQKIHLNTEYVLQKAFLKDIKIILLTFRAIIFE